MANYQVVAGNIGFVYDGGFYDSANDHFILYQQRSINGIGAASGEPVTMFKDGEIIKEYQPDETP